MKRYWVYILCSQKNGTLYVGVTNDLARRAFEHKTKQMEGFTKKYHLSHLVHVEEYEDVQQALAREKCLKKWRRVWKLKLIEESNPTWEDLYHRLNL